MYAVERHERTPEDIVRELNRTEAEPVRRPRPSNKRVWASIEKSPKEVIGEAFEEASHRDEPRAKPWVAVVDGNKHQLKLFKEYAASFGVALVIIPDVNHVLEYLWKAAWGLYEERNPEAQYWVTERLLKILRGESSQVAAGIRRSATWRGLEGKAREAMDTCADCLLKYKEYLRYDKYFSQGFPIASGVIEGACR